MVFFIEALLLIVGASGEENTTVSPAPALEGYLGRGGIDGLGALRLANDWERGEVIFGEVPDSRGAPGAGGGGGRGGGGGGAGRGGAAGALGPVDGQRAAALGSGSPAGRGGALSGGAGRDGPPRHGAERQRAARGDAPLRAPGVARPVHGTAMEVVDETEALQRFFEGSVRGGVCVLFNRSLCPPRTGLRRPLPPRPAMQGSLSPGCVPHGRRGSQRSAGMCCVGRRTLVCAPVGTSGWPSPAHGPGTGS